MLDLPEQLGPLRTMQAAATDQGSQLRRTSPRLRYRLEEVDFAGCDSIDAETRRPHGRTAAPGAAVEANVAARSGPADLGPDFLSGLVELRHSAADGFR
jgi:phage tail protein X